MKQWQPKLGEKIWITIGRDIISRKEWHGTTTEKQLFKSGNITRTKKEAVDLWKRIDREKLK